jgi:hypothetical protein
MSAQDRYLGLTPILAWEAAYPAATVTYTDPSVAGVEAVGAATLYGYGTPVGVAVASDGSPVSEQSSTTSPMGRLAAAVLTASTTRLDAAGGGIAWTTDGSVRGFVGGLASGDRAATLTFATVAQANAYGWATVGPHAATRTDLGGGTWAIGWQTDWLHDGLWVPRPEDSDILPAEQRNVTVRQSAFGTAASVVSWSGRESWTLRMRGIPWARVYRRFREDTVFAAAASESTAAPYNLLSGLLDAGRVGAEIRAWLFDRAGAELPPQRCRIVDPAMYADTSRVVSPSAGQPSRADVEVRLLRFGSL